MKMRAPDGSLVDAHEVGFKTLRDNEHVYRLKDGTSIVARLVAMTFYRLDYYNDRGEPAYVMRSANAVHAKIPSRLLKGGRR